MNFLRHAAITTLTLSILATIGCETMSFSDPSLLSGGSSYRGELTETHLLDAGALQPRAEPGTPPAPPTLHHGDRIMLVQSGAPVPDPTLIAALATDLDVTTYSGVPPTESESTTSIREAAVQAGIDRIVCVWGRLQSEDRATGATWISWVPVLGWNIDDSELTTELQLRFVLVDVHTGGWNEFIPESITNVVTHAPIDRDLRDEPGGVATEQATGLKRQAFDALVPQFLAHHGVHAPSSR